MVLHEVLHAVADENLVHAVVLSVLRHGGPVVAQVQEVDLRKVLAQERATSSFLSEAASGFRTIYSGALPPRKEAY